MIDPLRRFELATANPHRASIMYPTSRELFAPFRITPDRRAILESLGSVRGPFGLYAHVPFCEQKCSYCDYEIVPLASHDAASRDRYVTRLLRELEEVARAIPPGTPVRGFDIGGGTPGTLDAAQFGRLVDGVDRLFVKAPGFEISTETTPAQAAADPAKWKAIRALGIRRVSMGVQTASTSLLTTFNRGLHGSDVIARGFDALRAAGFELVNVDFMFALPWLTLELWRATVDAAITLGPDVVTIYDTVYKNRGIATQAARTNTIPTPDDYRAQYDDAFERLTAAGYRAAYGSVNFSRVPDRFGTSRYLEGRILDGDDYVGVGLYASSLVGNTWRFNRQRFADDRVLDGALGAEAMYDLPVEHVAAKYALLALSYGSLDSARFQARFGRSPESLWGTGLGFLVERGLLQRHAGGYAMVPGTFGSLPVIRSMLMPDDAVALLEKPVFRLLKLGAAA